jgi:transcriptional regulator with XRE-family HTH domain
MRLRAIRHRQKLTLKMLAKKAGGMSYTFLSNVETEKADPSLSTLKRLAIALGVSVSELVKDPPAESKRRP